MPGIELKSVEFFVFTSICQQLSPLLSVKRLKRLMHLLGSGVRAASVEVQCLSGCARILSIYAFSDRAEGHLAFAAGARLVAPVDDAQEGVSVGDAA